MDRQFLKSLMQLSLQEQKERILLYSKRYGCYFCESKDNLELHHLDPYTKEYTVSNLVYNPALQNLSKYVLIKELRKCVCLCKRCHKKMHKLFPVRPTKEVECIDTD